MKLRKNGAAACLIEQTNNIYIIGGNNAQKGEINRIEKYEIYFDRWRILDKKISIACHDLTAIPLSTS